MQKNKSPERPELSSLELEIMQEIWALGTATAAQVKAKLKRALADTTIHTVLGNLQKKGYVELVPTTERSKRYRPLVDRETVARRSLKKLVRTLFQGSPAEAMLYLVKGEQMGEEEMEEIRKLLEERGKEGGGRS